MVHIFETASERTNGRPMMRKRRKNLTKCGKNGTRGGSIVDFLPLLVHRAEIHPDARTIVSFLEKRYAAGARHW